MTFSDNVIAGEITSSPVLRTASFWDDPKG